MINSLKAYLISKYSLCLNQGIEVADKSNKEIGDYGEKVACRYIQSLGGKVLYQNYRGPRGGELDIVVRDRNVLAFVEVKTRTKKTDYSRPMDAVDIKKRNYIIRGAHAWIKMLKSNEHLWRYDVVEVYLLKNQKPEVHWVKRAFTEK